MGNVLIFAEHQHGKFPKTTLVAMHAGLELAAESAAASATSLCSARASTALASEIAKYGVEKVHRARRSRARALPRRRATPQAIGRRRSRTIGAEYVVATATAIGKDLMPRVAARLGAGMASDISWRFDADGTFVRPMYAGNVIGDGRDRWPVKVITVRGTAFEPAAQRARGRSGREGHGCRSTRAPIKTKFV